MEVRRSSWHYKLNNTIWRAPWYSGDNLCCYFWMTAWTVLVTFIIFPGLILAVVGVVGFVGYSFWCEPAHHKIAAVYVLSLVLAPRGAVGLSRYYMGYQPRHREPSLFGEYIRAKKQRVCPLIDFVD